MSENRLNNLISEVSKYDKNLAYWLKVYRDGINPVKNDDSRTRIPPHSCFAIKNIKIAIRLRREGKIMSNITIPHDLLNKIEQVVQAKNCKEVMYMKKVEKKVPTKKKWNMESLIKELEKLDNKHAIETNIKELKEMIGRTDMEDKSFLAGLRVRLNRLGYSVYVDGDKIYLAKK